MAQSEKELEKQLAEAGNDLLSPPSVTELLTLLDRVENALARVEQSPSESMKKALSPSMKALISDDLMRHSDVDVKVAVASCISEITRITAPDAPYEDDQMKEVFKLIVSSFEQLDDKASPSYIKRTSILETVAKVRSCVVMLDLECDDLIVEMFGCFFRSIRDDHPENVFTSMETIMVLVVEESEDISFDLLSSILDVLKTENKGVLPVARQLAEKVVEKCASKLKPYLLSAVKSQCRCLDDYSKVVANACHTGQEVLEPSDGDTASKNVVGENDVADVPPEKAVEVAMETLVDAPPSEEAGPASVGSPKSIMSNGTLQKETDDSTAGNTQSKEVYNENSEAKSDDEPTKTEVDPTKTDDAEPTKTDDAEPTKTDDAEPSKTDDAEPTKADAEPTKADADSLGVEEPIKSQSKPEKSSKRKGRKTSVLKGSSEPSECSQADDEMEVIKEPEDEEKDSKEVDSAKIEEPVTNATGSEEKEKEADTPVSSQKMSDNVGADISSPSCSENLSDESRSKKIGQGKKDDSVHLNETKGDGDNKKESNVKNTSEGTGVSETKSQKRSAKKASSASEKEDKIVDVDALNEEDETMEVDAKPVKKSGKKVEIDSSQREYKKSKDETTEVDAKPAKKSGKKVEIDSSQREDKNKGQVKGTPAKDTAKTPSKSSGKKFMPKASGTSTKDESDVEKTVKASSKRKRSPDEEKASKTKECGADLVGTKVKVWWPHDKKYYVGVVKSFDDVKKKHKIIYNDGDVEVLKLAKEKWEIVSDEHCADEISSSDEGPVDSTEMPKSKKVKASAEQRSKQGGKSGTSSKKGDASSSKSKATPKSGGKKKDDSKSDGKSKVESSKSGGKLEDKGGKSKDTKTGKKSSYETPKSGAKPKDDDDDEDEEKIIKGSNKSKQGTPKVAAKSKSKSSKSGSKSSTNGSGKVKAVLKDSEDEDSDDDMLLVPAKTSEAAKGNSSSDTSKSSQKSQSAKKRKRSAKN